MRPQLEVADIFRLHGPAYIEAQDGHLGRVERRVMSAITLCRTADLGGHVEACADCSYSRIAYNSCRNRHCPKCQGAAREQWLAARQADLLPVPYFHVVFTVPAEIAAITYQNKSVAYGVLFDAVAATLKTIGADARHLGGELGFIAILHTWGQTLTPRPRRRSLSGWTLDCLSPPLLPAHPCALATVPAAVPRTAEGRVSGRAIAVLRCTCRLGRSGSLF